MNKILISLFLISLTLCTEITTKPKIKKEEVNLQVAPLLAAAGVFVLKAAGTAAIKFLVEKGLNKAYYLITEGYFKDTLLEDGNARWVSNIKGGYVVSMYWHKTRRHSATCNGGFLGGGQKRVIAPAGHWAIAYCKAGVSGRKTHYNNL